MAAVLGDLIQIIDTQTILNQIVLNVYYYRVTSITGITDPYLAEFATWFEDNVIDPIRVIQNFGIVHTGLTLKNLSNGVDLEEVVLNLPGDSGQTVGSILPPYVTHTFRLVRESLDTRNGYKRFAGGSEDQVSNGVGSLPSTARTNIQNALAADIVIGAITLAEPVIVRRPLAIPAGDYTYSSIGAAQYRGLGSQNTRKIGRGI